MKSSVWPLSLTVPLLRLVAQPKAVWAPESSLTVWSAPLVKLGMSLTGLTVIVTIAALGVGHWRRARRAVVAGLVGEGVAGGLAAVVAVAEGAVGVEGHASVGRVAELGGGEGVALGVRVVGEDAGRRAVEHCDRAALGHGGAVVVGDRRVVDGIGSAAGRGSACVPGVGVAWGERAGLVSGSVWE